MKTIISISSLLLFWASVFAQDGSDIRYYKVSGVDKTLIGKNVHFDFYNRSFHGRTIDTVTITIDSIAIKFVEVRKDNGFNNWFFEQHLKSLETINGQKIKIEKFQLDSVTNKSFQVTLYVEYFDVNNRLMAGKSRQIPYLFDKSDIVEVLVESR
jgi:hypothetical protein